MEENRAEQGEKTERDYMRRALELAEQGMGWTSPNPMVGAVIVKEGRIIGEGFHERYGEAHAERNAFASCREDPRGADLYVTLEPCCHYGKQPPCTDAILEAGIRRVIIGSGDPNPLVAGKGIRILREHGVLVEEHVLEEECRGLNEVFFHFIQTGRPFVVMKYAMTMDGKTACCTGRIQMDYRRGGKSPCAQTAAQIPGHHGRGRNGTEGRSASHLQDRGREKSGADYLRQPASHASVFPDCPDCGRSSHHLRHLLRTGRETGALPQGRLPNSGRAGEGRKGGSGMADGRAGKGKDRQHSSGRRKHPNWSALKTGIVSKVQVYIAQSFSEEKEQRRRWLERAFLRR